MTLHLSKLDHFLIAVDVHELAPYIAHTLSLCILKSNFTGSEAEQEQFLHPKELQRLAIYTSPLRKKSYLLGRIAAKEAINTYWDRSIPYPEIDIEHGLGGMPKVLDHNINISIAHSHNYAVGLATSHLIKVGIDIEYIDYTNERTVPHIHEHELSFLQRIGISAPKLAYRLLWSAKEALVKYLEMGFVLPFHLLTIADIRIQEGSTIAEFTNFPTIQVVLCYTHVLVMAICIAKKVLINEPINWLHKC